MARCPELWNEQMPFHPPWSAWNDFINNVLENKPAKLVEHPFKAAHLTLDASDWGKGALLLGPEGERNYHSTGWDEAERSEWKFAQSTVAEPRAIIDLVKWAHKIHPDASIYVYTDHKPFVDAFWKCGSFSPGYNQAILELGATSVPVVLHHIPGKDNPSDGLSRGLQSEPSEDDWSRAAKWVEESALRNCRYYMIMGGRAGARTFAVRRSQIATCQNNNYKS